MLEGKLIFRDVCDEKQPWDAKLKEPIAQRRKKWEQSLPSRQLMPRSIVSYQEPLQDIEVHAFGDGSKQGVGATVYAVIRQQSGTTQHLVAAKERLSIPRLKNVAAQLNYQCKKCVGGSTSLKNVCLARQYGGTALDFRKRGL